MTRTHLIIATIVCCGVTSACVQEEQDSFCSDHQRIHAKHIGEVALLAVEIAETNVLSGSLLLPRNSVGGQQIGSLDEILVVGDRSRCAQTQIDVSAQDGALRASFEAVCDGSDAIKQVNVSLFDSVPLLDEVVVTIVTPATRKHFAISRRCRTPIFRLEQPLQVTE